MRVYIFLEQEELLYLCDVNSILTFRPPDPYMRTCAIVLYPTLVVALGSVSITLGINFLIMVAMMLTLIVVMMII